MRGFPNHINNRNDLDHLKKTYPNDTKKYLNKLITNKNIWVSKGEIVGEGVTDDTHKVITDEELGTKYQYELVDNMPPALKLGFTSYAEVISYVEEV